MYRLFFCFFFCFSMACELGLDVATDRFALDHCPACHDEIDDAVWSIPIDVATGDLISAIGFEDGDSKQRLMGVRVIALSYHFGFDIVSPYQEVVVDVGWQRTVVPADVTVGPGAHYIQVWYRDIPPVNNGRLLTALHTVGAKTTLTAATLGHGYGSTGELLMPYVDWVEDISSFGHCRRL